MDRIEWVQTCCGPRYAEVEVADGWLRVIEQRGSYLVTRYGKDKQQTAAEVEMTEAEVAELLP